LRGSRTIIYPLKGLVVADQVYTIPLPDLCAIQALYVLLMA